MKRPTALLFDVFGTLVDWYSAIVQASEETARRAGVCIDGDRLARTWRDRYLPSMEKIRTGERPWRVLDELHRESLDSTLAELGVRLPEADRASLVAAWHRLRPWPDVTGGLVRLRERFITAPLSNGHVRLLVDLARYADLRFDTILSAELAHSYKPDPSVYLTAVRLLGVPVDQVMLVACHQWDLDGAAAAGLGTAYVSRPLEWGPNAEPEPVPKCDVTATDLNDLASTLIGS